MMATASPRRLRSRSMTQRQFMDRRARYAAGFLGVRQALHGIARQRGVGGDDAVDAMARQDLGDGVDLVVAQVRGDLDRQRHVALVLVGQREAPLLQLPQQRRQFVAALQRAQVLGIGEEMFTVT